MSVKGRHAQKNHKGLTIFIVILLIVAILAVGAFVFREQITDVYNDVVKGTTTTTTATTVPTTTTVPETTTAPANDPIPDFGDVFNTTTTDTPTPAESENPWDDSDENNPFM